MKKWIYWLQQVWLFTRQKKSNSNESMLFWRRTDKTILKSPFFLRGLPPPFNLRPYFWAIFSWPLSFSKFQKQEPLTPNFRGGGNYVTSNKSMHLLVENELKKLNTLHSSYFIGKSHFEEDGTQNYLVFQPINRYFKMIANRKISSWKCKGLSDESIKPLLHLIIVLLH